MQQRDKYRTAWLRLHKTYERRAYNILIKYFREQALKVPYEYLDKDTLETTINNTIKIGGLYTVYYNMYNLIGLLHGERIGLGVNRDIKNFEMMRFRYEWQKTLLKWIMENVGYRIESVRKDFVKYIVQLVYDSFEQGITLRDLTNNIHKLINRRDFYKWQAERIARTESTLAANRSIATAGDTLGLLYDKIWISGHDARVRTNPKDQFDHRAMDGVQIHREDYFAVPNTDGKPELIEFPGSDIQKDGTRTSAGNVINCRCTWSILVRRDSNGRIIRQWN